MVWLLGNQQGILVLLTEVMLILATDRLLFRVIRQDTKTPQTEHIRSIPILHELIIPQTDILL